MRSAHAIDTDVPGTTSRLIVNCVLVTLLPDLDGVQVCTQLRAANVMTPILMLTARGAIFDRFAGLNAGVDDYLVKPVRWLAHRIAQSRAQGTTARLIVPVTAVER